VASPVYAGDRRKARPNDLTDDHRTRASREPMTREQRLAEFVVVLRQARRRAGLSEQQ
jgi:hypothetical protein